MESNYRRNARVKRKSGFSGSSKLSLKPRLRAPVKTSSQNRFFYFLKGYLISVPPSPSKSSLLFLRKITLSPPLECHTKPAYLNKHIEPIKFKKASKAHYLRMLNYEITVTKMAVRNDKKIIIMIIILKGKQKKINNSIYLSSQQRKKFVYSALRRRQLHKIVNS